MIDRQSDDSATGGGKDEARGDERRARRSDEPAAADADDGSKNDNGGKPKQQRRKAKKKKGNEGDAAKEGRDEKQKTADAPAVDVGSGSGGEGEDEKRTEQQRKKQQQQQKKQRQRKKNDKSARGSAGENEEDDGAYGETKGDRRSDDVGNAKKMGGGAGVRSGGDGEDEKRAEQEQKKQQQKKKRQRKKENQSARGRAGENEEGEGASAAVAQPSGLAEESKLDGGGGGNDNNDNSKDDGSNPPANGSAGSGGDSNKSAASKRTTFSTSVEDIKNAEKLNSKIEGDRKNLQKRRERKTKSPQKKAEGNSLGIPEDGLDRTPAPAVSTSDLSANAAAFVPRFAAMAASDHSAAAAAVVVDRSAAGVARTSGSKSSEGGGRPNDGGGKNGKKQKQKRKKNRGQLSEGDDGNDRGEDPPPPPAARESKANLTLQAIQQSKKKQREQHQARRTAGNDELTKQPLKNAPRDCRSVKTEEKGARGKTSAQSDPRSRNGDAKATGEANVVAEEGAHGTDLSHNTNKKRGKKQSKQKHSHQDAAPKEEKKSERDDVIAHDAKGAPRADERRRPPQGAKAKKSESNAPPKAKEEAIPPNRPQTTNDLNYGAGRPIVVVHIAEKPSIGQAIAQGLSGGSSSQSYGKLPTHEFNDPPFPKAPRASRVTHRVTSVAGHVFNVDFPSEYQSWDSVDPAELFHAPVVKKPCKGSVVTHLRDVTKGADFLVLWMDCDREGENINFEVLECCMHCMQGQGPYDRVYRAHFSAINPSDIKKAYHALGKPDRCQSLSVDARQELDLKVGVAFSRFQTRFFQGRYGDLDSAVLSYGPCQTPTLGFCVARHLEMETFKPEPYWTLDLGVMNSGSMCRATWDAGRSFDKNKVEALVAKCRDAVPAASVEVSSVTTKDKKQGRPVPLNTVALLKACSKALGIGPHHALGVAERLYLSGYLSYPRTESTRYPTSFDIAGTLRDQAQDNRWGKYVSDLLKTGVNVAKGGVDMGDHPPITPCRHARAGELSGDMARVYDLVARHFIASVSQDAVWRSTTIGLFVKELDEKGRFTIRGKQLVTPGFLAIMMHRQYGDEGEEGRRGDEEDEEEKELPEFKEGDKYGMFFSASKKSDKVSVTPASGKFCTLATKERMTTPPTYLTESELISRMEKHGIGTDASISTHIENIQKRNYVELIPGRKLKPSRLGLVLAQGYHLIDNSLVLPQVRSDIEGQCNRIAKGLAERDVVVKKAIELFSAKFNYFVENINKMDVLFGSSFAQLQDVGKPFTRCGLTRRYLQFITGPPPRLYNKTTEVVYPLPIGGEIKQWTGRHCPVEGCNFELCLYLVGAPPRTFPLCPNCYNNPRPEFGPQPGEETVAAAAKLGDEEDEAKERSIRRMAGKNMVRECPHPDGHPLVEEMTVSPDPESDGVLILDPHLGPKWRLVSTREPVIVHLPKSVEKVTILDKKDDVLGFHMMSIEFKDGQSPIEGKNKYTSCFANDEVMQGLVRVHHGDERLKASGGRGGRGRGGRGGGRGGRGRGGGRGRR